MVQLMMEKKPILELKKLSKSFPGVQALNQVDFDLYPGEVHIIAGENGAGKSTLIKCILGIHAADAGEICYEGSKVSFSSPREAMKSGIAAVHQELTLIPYLNATQNIYFGREPMKMRGIIDDRRMRQDVKLLMKKLHSEEIPLNVPVKYLGVANQQILEIAKALSFDSKVLILDEPTATLSEKEVSFLFEQIRILKEQGLGIIYISHRMSEYEQIGDRITVLRDGEKILTEKLCSLTMDNITEAMVGRKGAYNQHITNTFPNKKEMLLEINHISDSRGRVKDCSLQVGKGEIVGLAGLVGSGRTELSQLIFGFQHPKEGHIIYRNKDVTGYRPEKMAELGMGYLPEDRKTQGLATQAPISWNVVAASLNRYFPKKILSEKKNDIVAEDFVSQLNIATPDVHKTVGELSGGNQQKVVMAKWLAADMDFLIFDEPTRGVDIGAKIEIYDLIHKLSMEGKSILLISSELEELTYLCDRIYVMSQGRIRGELSQNEFQTKDLGSLIFSEEHRKKEEEQIIPEKNVLRTIPPAFYLTIFLMLLFSFHTNHYFSVSNLSNILNQAAPLLVVSCGQTFIILIQGTDLSLGSMMSVSGVLWIYLLNVGIPMSIALPLSVLSGVVMGFINGFVRAKGHLPIFIVTLGTQYIFKSTALLLANHQTLYFESKLFRIIGKGNFAGVTYGSWIAILCFFITMFLLRKTKSGRVIKGIGGNPEALVFMGTKISFYEIKAFLYAGILAAIAGILLCCRIESGNPNAGNGMEFNSIAAVLLGGTSMREGRGGVEGTIFGVLFVQVLKSGLMQVGISSVYQNAIIGITVLGAIVFDAFLRKKEEGGIQ